MWIHLFACHEYPLRRSPCSALAPSCTRRGCSVAMLVQRCSPAAFAALAANIIHLEGCYSDHEILADDAARAHARVQHVV